MLNHDGLTIILKGNFSLPGVKASKPQPTSNVLKPGDLDCTGLRNGKDDNERIGYSEDRLMDPLTEENMPTDISGLLKSGLEISISVLISSSLKLG